MNKIGILLSCMIDVYLFHLFFVNYFKKRKILSHIKFGEQMVQCITVVLLTLCNLLGNGDINIVITPLLIFLYTTLVFDGKIRYRLVAMLTAFCILYGCEFLFMLIIHPSPSDYKNSTFMIHLMFAIKLLSYIFILVINQVIGKRKRIQNTKIFMMYLLLPVASLSVMVINFYSGIPSGIPRYYRLLLVAGFGFLFLGNVVSFYAFERYSEHLYESMLQKVMLDRQKKDLDYYMQIAAIDKKQKETIHNITNQLKIINRLARTEDYKEIVRITEDISDEMNKDISRIYCSNPVLNSLLNEKMEEADAYGIKSELRVEPGINLDMISPADLIAMIGNLWDNAIRAAAEAENEKVIKGFFYMQNEGAFCVVKLMNTFKGVVQQSDGTFVTTKTDKGIHGIGIQSVNRIAEKYDGYLECQVSGDEFVALLILSANDIS